MRATDVDIVDQLLGGLAPGYPLLIAGGTGSGRSELCVELAVAAARRGEPVVYVTTQMPRGLARQFALVDFDLEAAVRAERIALLQLDPEVGKTLRARGARTLMDQLEEESPHARWILWEAFPSLVEELLDPVPLREGVECMLCGDVARARMVVACADRDAMAARPALERVLTDVCGALVELRLEPDGSRSASVLKSQSSAVGTRMTFELEAHAGSRALPEPPPVPAVVPAPAPAPETVAVPAPVEPAPEIPAAPVPAPAPAAKRKRARRGAAGEPAPEVTAPAAAPAIPCVAVIDEDAEGREQMARWLDPHYRVLMAADGFEALSLLIAEKPDVAVLELVLPRVSGYEVLQSLQRAHVRIPTLVLSGRLFRASDRIRPLILGAADVMTKPPTRIELLHRIAALLRRPPEPALPEAELPADPLALLAGSATRLVEVDEFSERLERTQRVGEDYGVASSLVGFEVADAPAFEAIVGAAEELLRAEDALTVLSEGRGMLLLVAADNAGARLVLRRIAASAASCLDVDQVPVRWTRQALPAARAEADLDKRFAALAAFDEEESG